MSSELAQACEELGSWLAIAGTLIAVQDVAPTARSAVGRPASRPPWNSQVAHALTDAHAGIRDIERDFRLEITGSHRARGGSDKNTVRALKAIAAMEQAVSEESATKAAKALGRWVTALMRLPSVDKAPVWEKIRAGPDGKPPVCPHCATYSLRVDLSRGIIACWFPDCKDGDGRRPVAQLEMSRVNGAPVVIWRDGLVM